MVPCSLVAPECCVVHTNGLINLSVGAEHHLHTDVPQNGMKLVSQLSHWEPGYSGRRTPGWAVTGDFRQPEPLAGRPWEVESGDGRASHFFIWLLEQASINSFTQEA
jgi:hypothetical protein